MKIITLNFLLAIIATTLSAQTTNSEVISWSTLKTFSAKTFAFNSDQFSYECHDCRYLELRSNSGVSGYFIIGAAKYSIKKKNVEGSSSSILIRLNPTNQKEFLTINESHEITDKGFNSMAIIILNTIFKRCYHSGMDAIIPASGNYTFDLFSEKEGELLIPYSNNKIDVINISVRGN